MSKRITILMICLSWLFVVAGFAQGKSPALSGKIISNDKGVVPVGFGTDALGGVVNIVTGKHPKDWSLDASYSYGSFNTHRSYTNFSYTSAKGVMFEVNAFQNYSDNNYWVDTPVEQFLDNGLTKFDASIIEHVRRFNDTYHNEAVIGKIGLVDKKWADRLVFRS